jgi:hypothetical protein
MIYDPVFPKPYANFKDIAMQMRLNVDILKQEITKHVDNEIERFKKETNSSEV